MGNPNENKVDRPTPFGLRLSDAERSALDELASALDRTPSQVIRRAIRFYRGHLETVELALRRSPEADTEIER